MAINVSLNKLPWYGQLGMFVAISIAAAGAFWYLKAQPMRQEIDAKEAQLATLRSNVERGLREARRLPEFRRQVTQLETDLERLKAVLPEEQDVAELLRRVEAMATQSNLKVRAFTPKTENKKQMHTEWPIGLQLEGSYHNLGLFFERVSKFPRIINIGDIKIKSHEGEGSAATISAECTATTFVLESKPAAAAPAAPGAPVAGRTE